MNTRIVVAPILVTIFILATSCSSEMGPSETVTSPPARTKLGFDTLMSVDSSSVSPVMNTHFLPAADAGEALHVFSGALVIPPGPMTSVPPVIEPVVVNGKEPQKFPGITLEMFSHGTDLVPVVRDLLNHSDPDNFWQFQADPGRVWSEPGDRGYSRASFPFIITGDVEGDAWNGIATFLYNDREISSFRYQIVQHSKPFFITTLFTAAGQIAATYLPDHSADRTDIAQAWERELADRREVQPWSALESRYEEGVLDSFDEGIDMERVLTRGLIIDDVIYARSVDTAFGEHPYPDGMRTGVWSMSKSMQGMVTMLRLAQKYGDEIFDYRIVDYLDNTATHDGWDEVTFGDALNMATGIGSGSENVDPNNASDGYIFADLEDYNAWYLAPESQEKVRYVFANPNHPWGPGEHTRYRDRDTFILSAAIDSLYKQREGPDADVWDMLVNEVYRPIGIHRMSTKFTTEKDGSRGVLFLAWALYMTVDDIAKVAGLLQSGGAYDGKQILHPEKLNEALYLTEARGLPTGSSNEYGLNSYHMSLWHEPFRTESGTTVSIPSMNGWGGMVVSLMPNGIIAYRLKHDGNDNLGMVRVANRIRPFDGSH